MSDDIFDLFGGKSQQPVDKPEEDELLKQLRDEVRRETCQAPGDESDSDAPEADASSGRDAEGSDVGKESEELAATAQEEDSGGAGDEVQKADKMGKSKGNWDELIATLGVEPAEPPKPPTRYVPTAAERKEKKQKRKTKQPKVPFGAGILDDQPVAPTAQAARDASSGDHRSVYESRDDDVGGQMESDVELVACEADADCNDELNTLIVDTELSEVVTSQQSDFVAQLEELEDVDLDDDELEPIDESESETDADVEDDIFAAFHRKEKIEEPEELARLFVAEPADAIEPRDPAPVENVLDRITDDVTDAVADSAAVADGLEEDYAEIDVEEWGDPEEEARPRRRRRRGRRGRRREPEEHSSESPSRSVVSSEEPIEAEEVSGDSERDGAEMLEEPRRRRRRRGRRRKSTDEGRGEESAVKQDDRSSRSVRSDRSARSDRRPADDSMEDGGEALPKKRRKVPTWDEAISGLIDANVKRHQSPSRSGRGRGRRRR